MTILFHRTVSAGGGVRTTPTLTLGGTCSSAMPCWMLSIWLTPYQHVTYANYYNGLVNWTGAPEEEPAGQAAPDEWWKE